MEGEAGDMEGEAGDMEGEAGDMEGEFGDKIASTTQAADEEIFEDDVDADFTTSSSIPNSENSKEPESTSLSPDFSMEKVEEISTQASNIDEDSADSDAEATTVNSSMASGTEVPINEDVSMDIATTEKTLEQDEKSENEILEDDTETLDLDEGKAEAETTTSDQVMDVTTIASNLDEELNPTGEPATDNTISETPSGDESTSGTETAPSAVTQGVEETLGMTESVTESGQSPSTPASPQDASIMTTMLTPDEMQGDTSSTTSNSGIISENDGDKILFPTEDETATSDVETTTATLESSVDKEIIFTTETIDVLLQPTTMSSNADATELIQIDSETTTTSIVEVTEPEPEDPEILSQTIDEDASEKSDESTIVDTPRSFPDETLDDGLEETVSSPTLTDEATISPAGADIATTSASEETTASDNIELEIEGTTQGAQGTEGETTESSVNIVASPATPASSEGTTVDENSSQTTSISPTTVTVVSIVEMSDKTVVVTTARPEVLDDDLTTTTSPESEGAHEFDCVEVGQDELETSDQQIPMQCTQMDGDQRRKIYLVINKSQVDPETLFAKNVKVLVKDFMVMSLDNASQVR